MRGKKAKEIRRNIYGDMSYKPHNYYYYGRTKICSGLRHKYKQAKQDYKGN